MRNILLAAAAGSAFMLPGAASAAAFINGSFESGISPGSFTTVSGGDTTSITGWTVTGDSVDYIGNYWTAQDGSRSVDLDGNGQGGIAQTFDTVAGTKYSVSFWLAGNPDGAPVSKTVQVGATGNASTDYTFDTTGHDKANLGWAQYTYNFVAGGASTTLSFASQTPGAYGPVLDNVAITAAGVPEPATWGLMILGFAAVGGVMRRRGATQAAAA